ncbi:MAG: hypothetical protein AB7U46_08730 [Paenirhodobacter sp.]|uniref:hypothetical protein n=1 Tax=Paenirhodobacter sp. TaxID=1965326 RepID=UPI003D107DBD
MRVLLAAFVLASLAGCTEPSAPAAPPQPVEKGLAGYTALKGPGGELIVKRAGTPFGESDGAEAKRAANSFCGTNGAVTGTEDNFRDGAWIFPGGCA